MTLKSALWTLLIIVVSGFIERAVLGPETRHETSVWIFGYCTCYAVSLVRDSQR